MNAELKSVAASSGLKRQGILQGHARREIEKIKRMTGKAVLLVFLVILAVVLEHVAMVDAQKTTISLQHRLLLYLLSTDLQVHSIYELYTLL